MFIQKITKADCPVTVSKMPYDILVLDSTAQGSILATFVHRSDFSL